MKFLPLIWAGLWRKPARSVLTLLSIVVAFLLFGVMNGLNAGFSQVIDSARLDRIFVGARFGGQLPIAYLDQIARLNGVARIAPQAGLGGYYQDPKNGFGIAMTDERWVTVNPEFNVTPELFRLLQRTPSGVILNRTAASRFGWKVHDRFPLQTVLTNKEGSKAWTFEVVAIVADNDKLPGAGMAVGNYSYLDEGRTDDLKGTIGGVGVIIKDPSRGTQMTDAIEAMFANSSAPVDATSEQAAMQNGLRGFIDLNFLAYALSAAALSMLLFLTGNVMAQSVRERVPEFAVLKTIGFSDDAIFVLILVEALIPYILGATLGLALSEAAPAVAHALITFGAPPPMITTGVIAAALCLAALAAVAGGLPAAWRVRQLSVVDALADRR